MAMRGKAALAMWWDMAAHTLPEFAHWHAHEHFPERLGIPGFQRASRWVSADGGEGIFVLYELEDHAVLGSPAYLARLNAPSPWSVRMMPHHRHMVRSQCRVMESFGGTTAHSVLTLRLSPQPGKENALRSAVRVLGERVAGAPGMAGLHLLRHEAPAIAQTEEQRVRGASDRVADWVLLACAYDAEVLQQLSEKELSDSALQAMGARAGAERATYALAYSATPADMVDA
ncbi:MAG: hypothetical protein I8H77_10080 [Comamonadaceae bacterium]|nr:hypothetical protein [Comamonadaceae bacterium]